VELDAEAHAALGAEPPAVLDADADAVLESERNREQSLQQLKMGTHSGMALTGLFLVWRVSVMAVN